MSYSILVVDDEAVERMALSQLLKREFLNEVEVHTLPNGMEMLKFLQHQEADIAIVDIDMPGMNGIETVRALRQQGNHMKIIINTAYSSFGFAVDAIKLEVDDYLVKPLRREKFRETVRGCMEKIYQERQRSEKNKNLLSALKPAIAGALLHSIAEGQITQATWDTYTQAMGIAPQCVVTILTAFPAGRWKPEDYQSVMELIVQSLSVEFDGIFCRDNGSGIIGMVAPLPGQHLRDFEELLERELVRLQKRLEESFSLPARIAVGPSADNVLAMHSAYATAKELLDWDNRPEICFYDRDVYPQKRKEAHSESSPGKTVRLACAIMEKEYYRELSLDDVAQRVGITPSYLSRTFKQEMGVNFLDYLTDIRIKTAIKLLEREELPIRELAERIGYPNHTYFCKVFKLKTGKTVNAYREMLHDRNQLGKEETK